MIHEFEYNLNSSGIHLLKLSLKSSVSFQKVLERIEVMEENITGKNSVSIIDPETRHMKDKNGKMGLNYNYQTVTDDKYGFRIAHLHYQQFQRPTRTNKNCRDNNRKITHR